jgi:hypothetical protein
MAIESACGSRVWTRRVFRVAVTGEAVLALGQAVLAGGFLTGYYPLLALHRENATITGIGAIVATLVAVLQWRPGRGPGWPVFACAGLFGAEALQIALGYTRLLVVHVPLGVSIISGTVLLTVWAWRSAGAREPVA